MLGQWGKYTTTTASGTSAVAGLAAESGFPDLTELFPVTNSYCWYCIQDSDRKPLEAGFGQITSSSNIDRIRVDKTFTGGTYDDTEPTALTLGSGTTYYVIVGPYDAAFANAMPGVTTQAATRGILPHPNSPVANTTLALTDDVQYIGWSNLQMGGVLKGMAIESTAGGANSAVQCGIYLLNHLGEPTTLLCRTGDITTTGTGFLSGTINGGSIWLPPGWYGLSVASKASSGTAAPTLRAFVPPTTGISPWGCDSGPLAQRSRLTKTQAGWTNLADAGAISGWTFTAAAGGNMPAVVLLFE